MLGFLYVQILRAAMGTATGIELPDPRLTSFAAPEDPEILPVVRELEEDAVRAWELRIRPSFEQRKIEPAYHVWKGQHETPYGQVGRQTRIVAFRFEIGRGVHAGLGAGLTRETTDAPDVVDPVHQITWLPAGEVELFQRVRDDQRMRLDVGLDALVVGGGELSHFLAVARWRFR